MGGRSDLKKMGPPAASALLPEEDRTTGDGLEVGSSVLLQKAAIGHLL